MELRTDRLILRPITINDADELVEIYADPDVFRFIRPLDAVATAQQVERFLEEWRQHQLGVLAVIDAATGRLLGRSGLHYWPQFDEVEVGWVLRRDAWGNGFATEAGAASVEWGFSELGLDVITAMIVKGNASSIAVAQRLGMTVLREDNVFDQSVFVYGKRR